MDHTPGFLKIVEDARPRVREISLDEARARQAAGARLVDVREDAEWNAGHAAGAEHIGKGVIERDIETRVPDKDTELVLYCGGGFRSVLASEALGRMGYTKVWSMAGGWRAWEAAGAPIERPEGEAAKPG
jgi:rhodanese-related sulfurtransferase